MLQDALLTAEESEALLEAMRDGLEGDQPEAKPTQLGAPDSPLRRALRNADEAAPRIAAALRDTVLRTTSTSVESRERPCEIVARDAAEVLVDANASWSISRDSQEIGSLTLGTLLGRFVLDRRLGTPEARLSGRPDARPLSALERRMLTPTAAAVLESLGATQLVPGTLELGVVRPLDDEDPRRFSPVLRLILRVTLAPGHTEDVCLVLHAAAFLPTKGAADDRARLVDRLQQVEVELVAVLGSALGSVRALVDLKVGDVIRLDGSPERSVPIRVQDREVLRGAPRVVDGNLAVEITEWRQRRGERHEKGKVA